jgi:uncharacterized protein YkwD
LRVKLCLALLSLLPGLVSCNGSNPTTGGSSFPDVTEVELASFNLINEDRRAEGLPELTFDAKVAEVARAHSQDMRDRRFFSHINPDGKTFSQRLRDAGVSFQTSGENLGTMSNISDPAVFANTGFLNSAEHRDIILGGNFKRVGVGVARSGSSYWITQDFVGP